MIHPTQELKANPRILALPRWRGMPIPFFATILPDGKPDFKVVDEAKRSRCAGEHLCFVCGQALTYWMVFMGGPRSAASRYYSDGPMHEECAMDVRTLCPFMTGRDYAPPSVFDRLKKFKGLVVRPFARHAPEAPEQMIMYRTRGFAVHGMGKKQWFFFAAPAISKMAFTRGGEK